VVPRSQRGGEVIEPMLSTQWFLRIRPLAERALEAVRCGQIEIVPERFEKIYNHWLENIEDWCISRQLWWGHRIPAWYKANGDIFVGTSAPDGDGWIAEQDVLDTWFSSGLWPFSALGWPEDTPDFRRYYPTTLMETGYDILFFWVARMIMLGIWFTDKPPFRTVYLHGLVRDKLGRKMSKTLNNVIDPLILINQFGADPLRFALVTGGTPGNDMNLDEARVERNWRFVNKLWQISNFVTQNMGEEPPPSLPDPSQLDLPSRWILSRAEHLVALVQRLFDGYQYGEAGRQIDDFVWGEFADWYLEISKQALYQGSEQERQHTRAVLHHVLLVALRLLHPFMPFVTEEAWKYVKRDGSPLILARWPNADDRYFDLEAERHMSSIIELIRGIRNVREQYQVEPARKIRAVIQGSPKALEGLRAYSGLFARLCNVHDVDLATADTVLPDQAAAVTVGDVTAYLPLAAFVDIGEECARLHRELERVEALEARSAAMLANEQFVSRARPDVVERERIKLADLQAEVRQLRDRIATLCG
jgi:valyl-tRNA synthetase